MSAMLRSASTEASLALVRRIALVCLVTIAALPSPARAVFIDSSNCLPDSYVNSNPALLQWVPLHLDAVLDTADPTNPLTLTFYGNVTGRQLTAALPPPDDPYWNDPTETNGKIVNVGTDNKFTTLFQNYRVLNYLVWDNSSEGEPICNTFIDRKCPVAPVFNASADDLAKLPAFTVQHPFESSYSFSTLITEVRVRNGDVNPSYIGCISANITPDLGSTIANVLCWLPAAILILKAIATVMAAIFSPWGSSDIFRWSSNYGRDEDLLRLVTPGFGDCLQYIQFIVLTGALSLQYPGFYQPVVSQAAWSTLLFNESFVSGGSGTLNPHDGIYVVNGSYGLTNLSQLVGMSEPSDVWACMAIWFLVIAAIVVLLCQLGFAGRWLSRRITHTSEEDLQSKNFPFTAGNMLRLLFHYFILPVVSLSLFQLVIAADSPTSVVVCAVILLVITILVGSWILKVIFSIKPRTVLFDDMPIVLLYGPLYNTYSDSAAPFALVPVLITFIRGVAIGAVQPSGIAQIIVLAICEVILILTLNAFRPFQGQTSMNAYHTFFAVVRLVAILLSIAFVPSLGVSESSKGWIGYVILLLHACVLVFGFFLNSIQTLIEVIARNFGVGADAQLGATRGSIINWRTLKKRANRPSGPSPTDRASMTSNAAMLQNEDRRSQGYGPGTRSRSISASSQQLLNRTSVLDGFSQEGAYANGGVGSPSADENQGQFPGYVVGANNAMSSMRTEPTDTYYRPPRQRTRTIDALTPGGRTRVSGANFGDFLYTDDPRDAHGRNEGNDEMGSGATARDSVVPSFTRDRADSNDNGLPRTDYAVREVDQYYRGPALSDLPRRTLKTGPADPEGPAANAQSWFQKLAFGLGVGGAAKQKDKAKGFEVVRRPPPRLGPDDQDRPKGFDEVELVNTPDFGKKENYSDSPSLGEGFVSHDLEAGVVKDRSVAPVTTVGNEHGVGETSPTRFQFGFDATGNANESGRHAFRPDSETLRTSAIHRNQSTRTAASSNYNRTSLDLEDQDIHSGRPSGAPTLDPIRDVGGFGLPASFDNPPMGSSYHDNESPAFSNVDLADTAGGQDWLRQIDRLSWDHSNMAASTEQPHHTESTPFGEARVPSYNSQHLQSQQHDASAQPGASSYANPYAVASPYTAPSIPARNSRRTPSTDIPAFTPGPVPQRTESKTPEHDWSGFDSAHTPFQDEDDGGYPHSSEIHRADAADESRPTSYHVSHKRAGDSISRNSLGAEAGLRGESATVEWGRDPSRDGGHSP